MIVFVDEIRIAVKMTPKQIKLIFVILIW